jgi:biotin carboxyl carrier protein
VGYFVPRDGLAVGHTTRNGDLLGHIDVLGVRQDVVSPADGVVGRLFVEPGEAVEYGQELLRVDPTMSRRAADSPA